MTTGSRDENRLAVLVESVAARCREQPHLDDFLLWNAGTLEYWLHVLTSSVGNEHRWAARTEVSYLTDCPAPPPSRTRSGLTESSSGRTDSRHSSRRRRFRCGHCSCRCGARGVGEVRLVARQQCPMAVLLPEKTVEIWTGISVARFLPFARIWSPPNYSGSVDQWIRAGKTWAFELKTAYEGSPPTIPIDLQQLRAHAFNPPHGVPVLYVLPAVSWTARPLEPAPAEGANWPVYPWWAWVVSARQLAHRFSIAASSAPSSKQAEILVTDLPFPHPSISTWRTGMWLAQFLTSIGACREPRGWTIRTAEDVRTTPPRADDRLTSDAESNYMAVHVPIASLPGPLTA